MAKITKTQAARQLGIARSTLYKLIDQGKLSPAPDGLIDQAELVRIAAYVDVFKERPRTSADIVEIPVQTKAETSYGRPQTDVYGHQRTDSDGRPQTSADVLVDILREQVQILREELQEARQSAQAAREREAALLQMLQESQRRYDRLLDMPISTTPPRPELSPHLESRTSASPRAPRGDMRRRIVALLREHPEGLTPAEIRNLLGVDRSLADTCLGMLRYGLVQRVGPGRYVVATS